MAPNAVTTINNCAEENQNNIRETHQKDDFEKDAITINKEFTVYGTKLSELKWINIVPLTILHILAIHGCLYFPYTSKFKTILWAFTVGGVAGFGVTAGAHRLWCHKSYKAKLPMQILLMLCYSAAGQNTIFDWVRDHRVHHKYSETDADPHNSNRGFFFAHMGWLFVKKHPEVIEKGRQMDMSDILENPVIQFHQKFFFAFQAIFCFILPSLVPIYFWDESPYIAFISQCCARYIASLHFTWMVNSAAHLFGNKPYDTHINPRENFLVAMFAMGEGWHNYHHTFPWDYKAAEVGKLNTTLMWLNLFARLGWAYDLKSPSDDLVKSVMTKRGDGSHPHSHIEVPEPADVIKKTE